MCMGQIADIHRFTMVDTLTTCMTDICTTCMAITLMNIRSKCQRPIQTDARRGTAAGAMIRRMCMDLVAGTKPCRMEII